MKCRKFLLILPILIFTNTAYSQKISNIDALQDGNLIKVSYNLSKGKFNKSFYVMLYVSFDGGKSFHGPMKLVTGDVGKDIKSGDKVIIWDASKEVSSLDYDLVFDVRAEVIEQKLEKHFFIHYTGNYSLRDAGFMAPFGLSVGQIGKIGWYASARINASAFQNADYDFDGTDVIGYDKVLYYEFDTDYKYPSLEAFVGVTAQLHWNFFLYGGVGYGYQKYYWHMTEYDYMTDEQKGDSYLNYKGFSESGIAAEAGFIVRAKAISFNIGYSTLNFSYSNIVFGIGVNF